MSATVTLTATEGTLEGKEFRFDGRTLCVVGRSRSCYLQVPDVPVTQDVSRRQCLLDIDPPAIRIRDLGSRNGTYVNGHKIGQRRKGQLAVAAFALDAPDYALHDGDEISMGDLVFRVGVVAGDATEVEPLDADGAGRRKRVLCL
jgi:pSer/pThr/pTyr-binding forkhead associated (FHA) protein